MTRPHFQGSGVDRDGLLGGGADPERCRIGGNVGAAGGRDTDLGYASLVYRGKYFDTVHGTVGDEDVLVGGVIRDAAMMRLAGRVIGGGYSIGTHVGGARKRRGDGRLNGAGEAVLGSDRNRYGSSGCDLRNGERISGKRYCEIRGRR